MTYGAPAIFSVLSKTNEYTLETVQRKCPKIILPTVDSCTARLRSLCLSELSDSINDLSEQHFIKLTDPLHCLVSIPFATS